MKIYVATAFRYGWINNGSYVVIVTTNKDVACGMAASETRGGKYGVEVNEFEDGATHGKAVAYYPSSYNEEKPRFNTRIALHEVVGNRVVQSIENGCKIDIPKVIEDEKRIIEIYAEAIK